MLCTLLKNKLTSFFGTVVNQVYTAVTSSTTEAVHKVLPTAGTKVYDILEVLLDPYDCFAFDYGYSIVEELMMKHIRLAYISNSNSAFSSIEKAKDAMKFDLASAMTTTMPGIYQDPRNIYGIMSPYQQERIDRQDYEFVDYTQELDKALIDQRVCQADAALKKKRNHKQTLYRLFRFSKK